MRTWRLVVVVLTVLALSAGPAVVPGLAGSAVAQTGADGVAPLDVAALAGPLRTQQVITVPGAIAVFDPSSVVPELAPDTRLVLAPPDPRLLEARHDEVSSPLAELAEDDDLAVILVTGLDVRTIDGRDGRSFDGTTMTGLDGLQVQLGSFDVTDLLLVATRILAGADDVASADPVPDTPLATAAEAAPVLAGLRGNPRWAAPGTDARLSDAQPWDELLTGVGLRVATLPPAGRGAPQPDLLPALTEAFPGEVVVVVRGRWIEIAGPDQAELTSARNWALGRFAAFFTERGTPVGALLRQVLERAEELRTGDPFARDPLAPTTLDRLVRRWVPPVALVVALVLLAGSAATAARRYARRSRVDAAGERARALAELASLDAQLLDRLGAAGDDPRERYAVATAAERRDTARTLFETSDDAGTAGAVRAAVAQSRAALSGASR